MLRGNAADLLGGLDGARVDGGAEGHMVQRLGVGLGDPVGVHSRPSEIMVKSPPYMGSNTMEEGHPQSLKPHTAAIYIMQYNLHTKKSQWSRWKALAY